MNESQLSLVSGLIDSLLYGWGVPEPIFDAVLEQLPTNVTDQIKACTSIGEVEGGTAYYIEENDWAQDLLVAVLG